MGRERSQGRQTETNRPRQTLRQTDLVVTLAVEVNLFRGDHDQNLHCHQECHQPSCCHHVACQSLHDDGCQYHNHWFAVEYLTIAAAVLLQDEDRIKGIVSQGISLVWTNWAVPFLLRCRNKGKKIHCIPNTVLSYIENQYKTNTWLPLRRLWPSLFAYSLYS